jgi:hypothetical protein
MDLVDYNGDVFPPPASAGITDSILFSMHGRESSLERSQETGLLVITS